MYRATRQGSVLKQAGTDQTAGENSRPNDTDTDKRLIITPRQRIITIIIIFNLQLQAIGLQLILTTTGEVQLHTCTDARGSEALPKNEHVHSTCMCREVDVQKHFRELTAGV